MPEFTFSIRDVGTTRRILAFQHPSKFVSLHLFRTHGGQWLLHDLKRGTSLCGRHIRQVDPVESEGARVRLCVNCFKTTGFAILGWVVTVTPTKQERLEV